VTPAGEAQLKSLIQAHADKTGSKRAQALLADWAAALPRFWQLVPPSEANTPEAKVPEPAAAAPQASKAA
jgi:glutamate synthase (ferredoxin)